MPFLTQHRFPILWNVFQYLVGGTIDKRKLCILKYHGQKQILEIGCSLGNIAKVFRKFPNISYTGIDIDPVVIRYAQKKFVSYPNYRFLSQDFGDFAKHSEQQFDYILFAGILHHIDDGMCQRLLDDARRVMSNDGTLVVVDPLIPEPEDNWFIKWFLNIEQGKNVRRENDMSRLLCNVSGLRLEETEIHYVGATPFSVPICARFGVYVLSKQEN